MKILLRRTGALGDVILATPILRRLRHLYPNAEITVQTAYPAVFKGMKDVDFMVGPETAVMIRKGDPNHVLADLDLAYEKRPSMHVVDAYMEEAFDDRGAREANLQHLAFDRNRLFRSSRKRYVAVHAAHAGWRNRTLPRATWVAVLEGLRANGLEPILVGTTRDAIDGESTSCLIPDIHVQAQLINSCACFVGSDSALLHVAGATDAPIVGIFTCVRPEYRMPYRDRCTAVVPDLDCVGCQERRPAPSTTESCEREDVACVGMVDPDRIVRAAVKMTRYS